MPIHTNNKQAFYRKNIFHALRTRVLSVSPMIRHDGCDRGLESTQSAKRRNFFENHLGALTKLVSTSINFRLGLTSGPVFAGRRAQIVSLPISANCSERFAKIGTRHRGPQIVLICQVTTHLYDRGPKDASPRKKGIPERR